LPGKGCGLTGLAESRQTLDGVLDETFLTKTGLCEGSESGNKDYFGVHICDRVSLVKSWKAKVEMDRPSGWY
jgi:hypothetical protein